LLTRNVPFCVTFQVNSPTPFSGQFTHLGEGEFTLGMAFCE